MQPEHFYLICYFIFSFAGTVTFLNNLSQTPMLVKIIFSLLSPIVFPIIMGVWVGEKLANH